MGSWPIHASHQYYLFLNALSCCEGSQDWMDGNHLWRNGRLSSRLCVWWRLLRLDAQCLHWGWRCSPQLVPNRHEPAGSGNIQGRNYQAAGQTASLCCKSASTFWCKLILMMWFHGSTLRSGLDPLTIQGRARFSLMAILYASSLRRETMTEWNSLSAPPPFMEDTWQFKNWPWTGLKLMSSTFVSWLS